MKEFIKEEIELSISTLSKLLEAEGVANIEKATRLCVESLKSGHKIIIAGNGGSAADSQHMAGELVSRFNFDRPGLPAIALTTDTSILTAIGNDYGYEMLFERQLQALGASGDVFIGISTSGGSPNIVRALAYAQKNGIGTIGLSGSKTASMHDYCDISIKAPSTATPKIQECHLVMEHIICGLIESEIFGSGDCKQ
jgi:D-sedoheptulose 7-phosphate isomerase